jgi:hypothetical protein
VRNKRSSILLFHHNIRYGTKNRVFSLFASPSCVVFVTCDGRRAFIISSKRCLLHYGLWKRIICHITAMIHAMMRCVDIPNRKVLTPYGGLFSLFWVASLDAENIHDHYWSVTTERRRHSFICRSFFHLILAPTVDAGYLYIFLYFFFWTSNMQLFEGPTKNQNLQTVGERDDSRRRFAVIIFRYFLPTIVNDATIS